MFGCLVLHAGYQVEVPAFAKRAALQAGSRMLVGVLSTPTPEKKKKKKKKAYTNNYHRPCLQPLAGKVYFSGF